jgi:K+/H+ antiporter YhaU regulatory subunit KhtT
MYIMDAKDIVAPVYSQIALDIALRITRGEIKENTKLYGRSVLASQYGVSPETIRRAMKLLEDMEVVEIREGRGSLVISRAKAQEYVDKFSEYNDIRAKQQRLKELLQEQEKLCRKISDAADSIVRINEHFNITLPFTIYEVTIPDTSPLVDRTLEGTRFWQKTRATIIAIRREDQIILSPGPYAVLLAGDIVMYIGDTKSVEAVISFINNG